MDNEIEGNDYRTITWDEIAEQMEENSTFHVSTGGTVTATTPVNANGVSYRIDGIDWGTNAATSVVATGARTTWDAGYVYAPYIPLLGTADATTNNYFRTYHTFQPVVQNEGLRLYYDSDTNEYKMYIEPTDHFIEHEDLFEI